ncbi:1819_t:CDS:2 [Ambispora leptoticha]|uniref:1819_t:CDS:1 n=1 Tax=Ambispora leptoticha TaxID=144679 RepID=A0A9N8VRQ6_9GLOM|nr:1819_t:CDS:2 [Ambispora leptoticha]
MPPKKHRLSGFIEILNEYSNTCNRYAICLLCIEAKGREEALKDKFTNTQRYCRNHLKECPHFIQKYNKEERQRILYDDEYDFSITTTSKSNKKQHVTPAEQAIKVVIFFHQSEFWHGKLLDKQAAAYNGKFVALQLELIISPYCATLNKLQTDGARLHEKSWKQSLLFLPFVLHPDFHISKFNKSCNWLTWVHFGKWVKYYYSTWFKQQPTCILTELEAYRYEKYPFDVETFNKFKDSLSYWNHINDVEKQTTQIRNSNIAIRPIYNNTQQSSITDNLSNTLSDKDTESNSDESTNFNHEESDGNIISINDWKSMVKYWLELVENESFEDDQDLLEPLNEVNTEGNNDFMNTLKQVQEGLHPADDDNAK